MKKLINLVGLLLSIIISTTAQVPNFEWIQHGSAGTSTDDYGHSLHYDKQGYIYMASKLNDKIYVKKTALDGTVIWSRIWGNSSAEARDITTDKDGNVYITGSFQHFATFDPPNRLYVVGNHWDRDAFVLKLDANGAFTWVKSFGGTSAQYGYTVKTDSSNNVYIKGRFINDTDFDPDSTNNYMVNGTSNGNFYLVKLNEQGEFQWMQYGGYDDGFSGDPMAVDDIGNIYIATYSRHLINNDYDFKIIKRDSSGNLLWTKNFEGFYDDKAHSIHIDKNGDLLVTGSFRGKVDFDPGPGIHNVYSYNTTPGPTTIYSTSCFALKLDNNGNLIWVSAAKGDAIVQGYSINSDKDGNVYIGGNISLNAIDFDPSLGSSWYRGGFADVFILKLDANGDFRWAEDMGGYSTSSVSCTGIVIDSTNSIYTIGNFEETINFAPYSNQTLSSPANGNYDFFVCKWSPIICTPSSDSINAELCNGSYTSPSGKHTWTSPGVYKDTLLTLLRCDSILTINLNTPLSFPTPYQEDFQGAFPPPNTSISNPDNSLTWDSIQVTGSDGSMTNAMYVNSFIYNGWAAETFFLPPLDLQIAPQAQLTFDLSYKPYSAANSERLFVEISTDCGDSYIEIYDKSGLNLGIGSQYYTPAWTPSSASDWRTETIDLTPYVGQVVQIKFLLINDYGNNIYIDNINVRGTTFGVDNQIACGSYTWIDGNTYTSNNNTATHTILGGAANGLDSTITLDLIINQAKTGIDNQTTCGSYTWIDGNTYTSNNNTATHTILGGAANGCDSIVTLDLIVNQAKTGIDNQTTCGSYTWIDGNTYTSNNNTATHTISSGAANGCDSIVTLNLNLNPVNTSTTLNGATISSNGNNPVTSSYQWLDCNNGMSPISGATNQSYTAATNGSYAVQITENGCIDTSTCIAVIIVGFIQDNFQDNFTLFPNPTHGKYSIQFDKIQENLTIRLLSVSGQLIQQQQFENTQLIQLETLEPSGVYLIELIDKQGYKSVLQLVKK